MKIATFIPLLISVGALAAKPDVAPQAGGGGLKYGSWEQELPEMGRVTTGVLTTGKESFVFMPPTRWRIESEDTWAVRWIGAENAVISIRLLLDARPDSEAPSIRELLARVETRLPQAKVVRETTCYTEAESGPGCDLEWRDSQGRNFNARVALVRVGGRAFEFCLVTPAGQFDRGLGEFAGVLTSFQAAKARPGS